MVLLLVILGLLGLFAPEQFGAQHELSGVFLLIAAGIFVFQIIAFVAIRKAQKRLGVDPLDKRNRRGF